MHSASKAVSTDTDVKMTYACLHHLRPTCGSDHLYLSPDTTAEVDTSGDLEYALMLDRQDEELRMKELQAKHKQQLEDARLAQRMQLRLSEKASSSADAMKVLEIISSDSDKDHVAVVKQERSEGTPGNLGKKRPNPQAIATAMLDEILKTPEKHEKRDHKAAKVKKHRHEKKHSKHGSKIHSHVSKKRTREEDMEKERKEYEDEEKNVSPALAPPSVAPPVAPPSVPPPSVGPPAAPQPRPTASGRNQALPAKRGRKAKHHWTIDEYLHIAKIMSAPRFETPTLALRTLHRGHLLLDITSPNVLRNAWQHLRSGVTSPLHDARAARALEYACCL